MYIYLLYISCNCLFFSLNSWSFIVFFFFLFWKFTLDPLVPTLCVLEDALIFFIFFTSQGITKSRWRCSRSFFAAQDQNHRPTTATRLPITSIGPHLGRRTGTSSKSSSGLCWTAWPVWTTASRRHPLPDQQSGHLGRCSTFLGMRNGGGFVREAFTPTSPSRGWRSVLGTRTGATSWMLWMIRIWSIGWVLWFWKL